MLLLFGVAGSIVSLELVADVQEADALLPAQVDMMGGLIPSLLIGLFALFWLVVVCFLMPDLVDRSLSRRRRSSTAAGSALQALNALWIRVVRFVFTVTDDALDSD